MFTLYLGFGFLLEFLLLLAQPAQLMLEMIDAYLHCLMLAQVFPL
jgi:hypothetical protein